MDEEGDDSRLTGGTIDFVAHSALVVDLVVVVVVVVIAVFVVAVVAGIFSRVSEAGFHLVVVIIDILSFRCAIPFIFAPPFSFCCSSFHLRQFCR